MDGQEILITSMCPRGREDRGKEREKENERMKMRDVEQRKSLKRWGKHRQERERERQWNRNERETNNTALFYYLEYLNAWKYSERTKAKKRQIIALRLDIFVRI